METGSQIEGVSEVCDEFERECRTLAVGVRL